MSSASPPGSFNLQMFVRALGGHWRRALLILASSLVIGLFVSLLLPTRYEGTTTLSPAPATSDRGAFSGALATLGGQFGLDLGTGSRVQLRFYPRLIRSYWFLSRLATTPLPGDATTVELLGGRTLIPGAPNPQEMDAIVQRLDKAVGVDLDDRANVFTVSIRMPTRESALALTRQVADLIAQFDTRVRRSRASENRVFIEGRAAAAQASLAAAESSLTSFLARNRSYEQAPELRLRFQRLERRVGLAQEVYVTLARNLEQARIEEAKEVPVLTVVDPPRIIWRRAEPRRRRVVVGALSFGVLVVLILGLLPPTWPQSE